MSKLAELEARARKDPDHCVRCSAPTDMRFVLQLTNSAGKFIRHTEPLSVCRACAADLLAMPTARVVG